MASITEARSRWETTLNRCSTLSDLQRAVRYGGADSPTVQGCRSLCWKIFLLFNDLSSVSWVHTLRETRASYGESSDHLLRFIRHPEALTSLSIDPLTDDPNSPWNSARQDEALRAEIAQDVRRLPDEPFYHQERIQTMIIDILFVYCKLNSVAGGYRQGMHELLAPIVYVVEHDSVDSGMNGSAASDSDRLMVEVLDRSFVENDSFALFSRVMDRAASFYEVTDAVTSTLSPDGQGGGTSAIVEKSRFIHEVCLDKVDPELSRHLTSIEILPQIFLIRWIRLLFGREFPFDDLLFFWDTLFAVDPRLELVDLICVAMLLRIRWELLEADYSVSLQLLLKYPTPTPPHGPHTFIDDALYLRDHLNPSGATSLLMKYTGKVPSTAPKSSISNSQAAAPSNSRNPVTARARSLNPRVSLPSRLIQQPGGVEALLQVAAKNVLQRGEKLGINQAVREAMGEIRRNVQTLQDARSQSPQPFIGSIGADTSDVGHPDETESALEKRNQRLAAMLEEGLAGLKAITADDLEDKAKSLEMIEFAASKVELVKACLENPSVDLPGMENARTEVEEEADVIMESTPEAEKETVLKIEAASAESTKKPGSVMPDPVPAISSLSLSDGDTTLSQPTLKVDPSTTPPPTSSDHPDSLHSKPSPTRAPIAQSSFAWMLEPEPNSMPDDAPPRPSTSDRPPPRSPRRKNATKKNAFLFGEVVPPGDESEGEREIFGLVDRGEQARGGGKGLFG